MNLDIFRSGLVTNTIKKHRISKRGIFKRRISKGQKDKKVGLFIIKRIIFQKKKYISCILSYRRFVLSTFQRLSLVLSTLSFSTFCFLTHDQFQWAISMLEFLKQSHDDFFQKFLIKNMITEIIIENYLKYLRNYLQRITVRKL